MDELNAFLVIKLERVCGFECDGVITELIEALIVVCGCFE